MKKLMVKIWLPIVIAGTISLGTLYIVVQQNLRMSANDPQIQITEDGAALLADGMPAEQFVGRVSGDIRTTLATFVMIYDEKGKLLASSIANHNFTIPAGVLDFARTHDDNRITWQPTSDVRIAAVVRHFGSASSTGFIVTGRSLREIEARIGTIGLMIFTAWVAMIVLTLLSIGYVVLMERNPKIDLRAVNENTR